MTIENMIKIIFSYLLKFLTLEISSSAAAAAKSLSVVSNSVQCYRWQPTRLHRPWDSPGKNTGVGCHFLLQCMKVKSEVTQSCPTPSDPMDCRLPGSSVLGICQARVLEWVAIAFSNSTWVSPFSDTLTWSLVIITVRCQFTSSNSPSNISKAREMSSLDYIPENKKLPLPDSQPWKPG